MLKRLYILATLAMLLAGCGKEPVPNPDNEQGSKIALAFTYKSYTSAATYATNRATVPAETAEKVIRDLSIFAFYADGTFLRELVADTDYTETVSGDQTTVTVSDDFLADYLGKSFVFYFVANNAASTGGTHITTFAGTVVQFEELLTSALANGVQTDEQGSPRAENITITPGAGGLLMTGKTTAISIFGKRTVPVTLKRRVARFDINNPKPTEYRVTEIFLTDARTRGQMFADAQGTPVIPVRSTDSFSGPTAYDGTLARCAFYLYPTDLLTTTITLEVQYIGASGGTALLFHSDNANVVINANKRYTLTLNPADLTFTVGTGDYDEDDDDGEIGMG